MPIILNTYYTKIIPSIIYQGLVLGHGICTLEYPESFIIYQGLVLGHGICTLEYPESFNGYSLVSESIMVQAIDVLAHNDIPEPIKNIHMGI